jgi:PAS domain-containing protein
MHELLIPMERRMSESGQKAVENVRELLRTGTLPASARGTFELQIERPGGMPAMIEASVFPIKTDDGFMLGALARDVTERHQAAREREVLIGELQAALSEVKQLSGLLPICGHCKKIRDDSGAWHPLEVYFKNHSDVDFSHGLCPECLRKYYPDFAE